MRALEISTASKADTIAAYRARLADNPEQQAVDRLEQQIQALREVRPGPAQHHCYMSEAPALPNNSPGLQRQLYVSG